MPFAHGLGKQSENILLELRDELLRGKYPVGACVPTEKDLCERYGVSRSTVRRALARLVAEGLLEAKKSVGHIVCNSAARPHVSRTISIMYDLAHADWTCLQQYLLKQDYLPCVYTQNHDIADPHYERAFLERVLYEHHHGLVAACTYLEPRNDELIAQIVAAGTRVIHVNPFDLTVPDGNFILPDFRRAGYMSVAVLLMAGYDQIVHVNHLPSCWPSARLFHQGIREALNDLAGGYDAARHYIDQDPRTEAHDNPALQRVLRERDASVGFICRSEALAGEVADALALASISVPNDCGIIKAAYMDEGVNDIFDTIGFDRLDGMLQALDALVADDCREVRTFLEPHWIKHGTVRASQRDEVILPAKFITGR